MNKTSYAALGETVCRETLPNGLQVFVVPRPDYGKQFAFFAVRFGGMNTCIQTEDGEWTKTPAGVAHYLEHKLFDTADGTVTQKFASNGAADNAFTAADMTGYFFEGTEQFEENLKTLLTFVSDPYFTDETVQKEQGIIAQEIRMNEDDPYSELYYKVLDMVYCGHPVTTRIAGTVDSIAEITKETLYRCHKAFYRPGNMVLCVAGNISPERVCAIAREVLPGEHSTPVHFTEQRPELREVNRYAQWTMPVSAPLFNLLIKGEVPPVGQCLRSRLIAELACDVLFGASSELYNRLYDEGLINDAFGGDYEFLPGAAYVLISGESEDPEQVRDRILAEAQRLASCGIDPIQWERLLRAAYGSMVRRLNSLEDTCIELVQSCFDGEDYLKFPEVFQSIEKKDVEALLNTWCTAERTALAVVMPQET